MTVAADILGERRAFAPIPCFWSDQYDTRIQAYGVFPADAEATVVNGSPESRTPLRQARFFVKNASSRSNGMTSLRSYRSTWSAPGTTRRSTASGAVFWTSSE